MNQIEISHWPKPWEREILNTNSFQFSGGEIQAKASLVPQHFSGDVTITARLQSSDDVIHLLLLLDLLNEQCSFGGICNLVVPYFPYARQDRRMAHGEAFSLKSIARLIDDHPWHDNIIICDPHSDVTPALLNNCRVIEQDALVRAHSGLQGVLKDSQTVIVSPDAGAYKKAWKTASAYGLDVVTATKVRCTKTGDILSTELPEGHKVAGRACLIVDDICDGGRTFLELAKVLKKAGASKVLLYVTHGIFSKGVDVLYQDIDGIYTTDSFKSESVLRADDMLWLWPNQPFGVMPLDFDSYGNLRSFS